MYLNADVLTRVTCSIFLYIFSVQVTVFVVQGTLGRGVTDVSLVILGTPRARHVYVTPAAVLTPTHARGIVFVRWVKINVFLFNFSIVL